MSHKFDRAYLISSLLEGIAIGLRILAGGATFGAGFWLAFRIFGAPF